MAVRGNPSGEDLFGPQSGPGAEPFAGPRPLADRLRPQSLEEVVGQDHLLGPDGTLTRMLARGSLASLILWGPPGCGKTTIARLLAARSGLHFVQLSAVFSGVADLKRAFDEAARRRRTGQGTLLFVDEIHRFNRGQQDALLPPRALSAVLREWLEWYPEKVLYGTDLAPGPPEIDCDVIGYSTNQTARKALAIALTGMMNDGEITRERALELARMVLRENAMKLYGMKD